MGKSANAGGGQTAKAQAKSKASASDAASAKAAAPAASPKAAAGAKAKAEAAKPAAAAAAKAAESKAEDEKAKLQEEARQKLADDERDEKSRVQLREENRKVRANGAQLTGSRDKSLVRVQRFQNRLKLFKGESELQSVIKDIEGVDASKFVSELAECVMEAAGATLKLKELFSAVTVCTRLHGTYGDFSALLAKAMKKAYDSTPATELARRRLLLRMCAELTLVECIAPEKSPLADMVKELCDISVAEEQLITNFTIIASLVQKHAVSCFNSVPAKQKAYEEALGKAWTERSCLLPEAQRNALLTHVVNAYQSAAAGLLQAAHGRLVEQERLNSKLRVDKGAVDAENEQKHQQLKENLTKLQGNLSTLSEFLNQPMPSTQEEDANVSRVGGQEKKEDNGPVVEELPQIWADAEEQRFYEEIQDLKDVIPGALLNASKGPAEPIAPPADGEKETRAESKEKTAEEKDALKAQMESDFELYLARVGKAESPKQLDEIVNEFFHDFNTKANRRALAHTLYSVPRQKLHMLAPHARLICTVAPYLKEVPQYVMAGLQQELEQLIAEKNPIAIESKVRTVRYLCELCKFKICPPGVILDMFKTFCDDFSLHHAELCANTMNCCGRYLMYTPETATRTENLLERMMRLKNAKSALGLQLEIMLEEAYYQVKPPESKRQQKKDKDPLQLFTQDIVYTRLYTEEDEDRVLKLVRKLPWSGPAPGWLKKSLLDLNMHANYESLYLVASLLSGLAKYHDAFVIDVIDALFENIQVSLERNDFREMPLRVRQAKLLGELYNYRLVDSGLIFDTMYHLIGLGGATSHRVGQTVTIHKIVERCLAARKGNLSSISEEAAGGDGAGGVPQLPTPLADPQHPLEAPWDYFRIKLVCVLLETCGHYFDRGAAKQKLDRFLNFFLRYVQTKGELPLRFMNMVYDTLERLRPKLTIPTTPAAADEVVMKILQSERESLDLEGKDKREEEAEEEEESSEDEEGSDSEEDESGSDDSEEEEGSESDDSEEDDEEYNRGEDSENTLHREFEEFDKEVQQILIDSIEREKTAPRVLSELPTPKQSKLVEGGEPKAPGMLNLLQRRPGGKIAVRQIEVPDDSKLLRSARANDEAATKEKEDLKQFILQYDPQNSAPGRGGASSSRPGGQAGVRTHAGKGRGKGGGYPRRNTDYVKDEFLPEEERREEPQPPMFGGRVHVTHKGGGHKGRGGGGGIRRSEARGTPPQAAGKGAL